MGKRNTSKKIVSAILSTSLVLSLVNGAFAETKNPTLFATSKNVSTVENADVESNQTKEARISTITTTNGTISVKLTKAPEKDPILEDFGFTKKIDEKKEEALKVSSFTWDKAKKTAVFTFKPITSQKKEQKVAISVNYKGSKKTAKAFYIAAKDAVVDKVEIVNNANDANLTLNSIDDAKLVLAAIAKDKDGKYITGKKITWKSENKAIATVDSTGKVTAKKEGKAVISATIDKVTATFEVTVISIPEPSLELGNLSLNETAANDGSINGAQVVTLKNGKFAPDLTVNDIKISSLPEGLGYEVKRDSDTKLTISFTGKAVKHTVADSKKDVTITVGKGMIIGATKDIITPSFTINFTDPVVIIPPNLPEAPSLTYANGDFKESANNDGSVSTTKLVTLTGSNNFVSGPFVAGVHYNATNVPAGLTLVVTRINSTQVTIGFTGKADNHANANDASNVAIQFLNAAFTSGNAAGVTNSSKSNLVIDFSDVVTFWRQEPTGRRLLLPNKLFPET
ncbi:Ig-like domain-containing protein [Brevibacillus sp. SYSU BS000544]|uniref:Ig-like domain-containing protein n=1 Tax=Brevibacillus sp. SYSU BS000544 TaxID=3416443 RepID=UPI003CE4DC43